MRHLPVGWNPAKKHSLPDPSSANKTFGKETGGTALEALLQAFQLYVPKSFAASANAKPPTATVGCIQERTSQNLSCRNRPAIQPQCVDPKGAHHRQEAKLHSTYSGKHSLMV